jgi:hypothetical protein
VSVEIKCGVSNCRWGSLGNFVHRRLCMYSFAGPVYSGAMVATIDPENVRITGGSSFAPVSKV